MSNNQFYITRGSRFYKHIEGGKTQDYPPVKCPLTYDPKVNTWIIKITQLSDLLQLVNETSAEKDNRGIHIRWLYDETYEITIVDVEYPVY